MTTLPVIEKFVSINGEGRRAGALAAFIRFRGCNLRCAYCDTAYASDPDMPVREETPESLVRFVAENDVRYITLTGGEPLLQPALPALLRHFTEKLPHIAVEIETNGSISVAPFCRPDIPYKRPSFTVDYKLPSSGMEHAMGVWDENAHLLTENDTVKFVVGTQEDLLRTADILARRPLPCPVFLSPVFGSMDPAEIVAFMKTHHLNTVRLQLQLHKYIWDPRARGV